MHKRNVELLVKYGADINWYQPEYEASAAARAAGLAQWDVLDFLLERGTNVGLVNVARSLLTRKFNEESIPRRDKVLKLLQDRGVDMEAAKLPRQPKPPKLQTPT